MIRQLRDRKREGSILSGLSADSLTSDEQTQWRLIRKDFEGSGLTLSVLDNNRELIIECLTAALGSVEMRTIDNDTVKDGKGKDQVNQPPPVIDLDTTVNPFLDSTFEVTTETCDKVKEMASDEISIDARSEKEEANLVALTFGTLIHLTCLHDRIGKFKHTRWKASSSASARFTALFFTCSAQIFITRDEPQTTKNHPKAPSNRS